MRLKEVHQLSFNAALNGKTAITSLAQMMHEINQVHEWVRAYGSDLQRAGVKDYIQARATSALAERIQIELGPLADQIGMVQRESESLMTMIKEMSSE